MEAAIPKRIEIGPHQLDIPPMLPIASGWGSPLSLLSRDLFCSYLFLFHLPVCCGQVVVALQFHTISNSIHTNSYTRFVCWQNEQQDEFCETRSKQFLAQILCFAANASTYPVSQILQISRDHEYHRNYMNRMDHPNACYMDDSQKALDVYYMTFKAPNVSPERYQSLKPMIFCLATFI